MITSIRETFSLLSIKEKITYFALVCLRIFTGFLDVAGVGLVGIVVLVATSNEPINLPHQFSWAGSSLSTQQLPFLLFILLVLFVGKGSLSVYLIYKLNNFLSKIETEKALLVAKELLLGDLSNMKSKSQGDIQYAIGESTSFAFSQLLISISTIAAEVSLAIFLLITFFVVDPIATLFVILYFGLVIGVAQFLLSKKLRLASDEYTKSVETSVSSLTGLINAFREITVYRKGPFFLERYGEARSSISSSLATQRFLLGLPRYLIETALIVGVLLFVSVQSASGQISDVAPVIGIFLVGGVRLMASLIPLQSAVASFSATCQLGVHSRTVLLEEKNKSRSNQENSCEKEELKRPSESFDLNIPELGYSVEVQGVTFTHPGNQKPTIHNLSLSIEQGQHVAFIGPSGSGKSTIIDLILGLIKPDKGKITINRSQDSGYRISYVAQKTGLIQGSLAENVAFGIPTDEINLEQLEYAITSSGLKELVQSSNEGYFLDLGKQLDSLSGGQIQRIGIARALYAKPNLLIMDEATSSLDAETESIISNSIQHLGDSTTVIVVAHRLSTVQNSDSVFLVENGEISGHGKFSDLLRSNSLVEKYVNLMSIEKNSSNEK